MRALLLLLALLSSSALGTSSDELYLTWSLSAAESVGKSTYVRGSVGSRWHERGLKTERAINYKLAATWFTPEVIRACARYEQLRHKITDQETREMVASAEADDSTVIMVELDPNEGSGVIPNDWEAFLQPKGVEPGSEGSVIGSEKPELRKDLLFAGTLQRNYDYDRFWVSFPLKRSDGQPLFPASTNEAELVVRVKNQQGKVSWKIPDSFHQARAR